MIEELYREHAGRVYARLLFATGRAEVAADLTQDTFERILRQDPAQDPVARLNTIAEGLLIDYFRAEGRRKTFPVGSRDDLDRLSHGRQPTPIDAEFHEDFDVGLRDLPEPNRDAFILTDLRGLDVREAAGHLDVHYSTVSRRASAARSQLRKDIR